MGTIKITDEEKRISHEAYVAFNEYATIDGGADISAMPQLRRLQIDQHRWQARAMRPDSDQSFSVMVHGMTEEGSWELIDAIETANHDEQVDSIGDLIVYSLAVCTSLRLDFHTLARNFDSAYLEQQNDALISMVKCLGMLNHIAGKEKQHTRGYDDVAKVREHAGAVMQRLCAAVHWMCFANDWDATVVLDSTLQRVMQRNWNVNQTTGDVSAQTTLEV